MGTPELDPDRMVHVGDRIGLRRGLFRLAITKAASVGCLISF